MKKRFLSVLLCASMAAVSLAACSSGASSSTATTAAPQTTSAQAETTAKAEETTAKTTEASGEKLVVGFAQIGQESGWRVYWSIFFVTLCSINI